MRGHHFKCPHLSAPKNVRSLVTVLCGRFRKSSAPKNVRSLVTVLCGRFRKSSAPKNVRSLVTVLCGHFKKSSAVVRILVSSYWIIYNPGGHKFNQKCYIANTCGMILSKFIIKYILNT